MSQGQDALSGAATGAAIGSAFGPGYGTVIGGLAGGLYGYFSGGNNQTRGEQLDDRYGKLRPQDFRLPGYKQQYDQYGQYAGARGGSEFRGGQEQLGSILAAEANGNGVGQRLVGMQARQAADRASAQQFAALSGARPGQQAMASRNAMLGTAMAQSAVGEQAALGSAQATLGAQGLYSQHLQGARSADDQMLAEMLKQRQQAAQAQQQGYQNYAANQTSRFNAELKEASNNELTLGALQGAAQAWKNR